ncbi:MAG: EutN/CcmL family microcompartment protein [Planctomycetota bacterium]
MIIARVVGTLFATRKHARFDGKSLLLVREESPRGQPLGPSFLAVDRVEAGVGDRVLVNREGSGARLMFDDEQIPLQAVIVGVVDAVELSGGRATERPERSEGKP